MTVAKVDGYSVLLIAGMGAFLAASGGGVIQAVMCCLAAGCGALEVHGAQQLARGDEAGVNWLVRAQLLLMAVILSYAAWQLAHFDEALVRAQIVPVIRKATSEAAQNWNADNPYAQMSDSDLVLMVRLGFAMVYCVLGVATCVYQGLMARYYHKRRAAVAQALASM